MTPATGTSNIIFGILRDTSYWQLKKYMNYCVNSYGRTPGTVTNLLNDLEWEPLQERRKQARHKLLQKSLKEEVVLPLPAKLQRSVWITC